MSAPTTGVIGFIIGWLLSGTFLTPITTKEVGLCITVLVVVLIAEFRTQRNPRTDACELDAEDSIPTEKIVLSGVARQLEKDLTAAHAEVERLTGALADATKRCNEELNCRVANQDAIRTVEKERDALRERVLVMTNALADISTWEGDCIDPVGKCGEPNPKEIADAALATPLPDADSPVA